MEKDSDEYYRSYCGKIEHRLQRGWPLLPKHLLEEIFDQLPVRNRHRASMACFSWYTAAMSPASWRTFVYNDFTFTRRKYTIHSGWQPTIDHYRLKFLVNYCVRWWRHLILNPETMLFNLYEFLRVLTNFTEYYENHLDNPLSSLKRLDFNWSLKLTEKCGRKSNDQGAGSSAGGGGRRNSDGRRNSRDEVKHAVPPMCGTGGQVLKQFTHFLSHLHGLESLNLRNLLLDANEADQFMKQLLEFYHLNLSELCLRNLTKNDHSLLHLGLFLNLAKLTVSPQHLNDDSLHLIGQCGRLKTLILIQDEYTNGAWPLSEGAWIRFKTESPETKVHLKCSGRCEAPMVWQPMAPVISIVYSNSFARLTDYEAVIISEYYSDTLEIYVQTGAAKRYRSKKFDDRADAALILLLKNCAHLKFVAIRERLGAATLLYAGRLMAPKKTVFTLRVRRNAILKRCDWPADPENWTENFYQWLKIKSKNYTKTEEELRKLLGEKSSPLSDRDYRGLFLTRNDSE